MQNFSRKELLEEQKTIRGLIVSDPWHNQKEFKKAILDVTSERGHTFKQAEKIYASKTSTYRS